MLLNRCRSTILIVNKNSNLLSCQKINTVLKNSLITPSFSSSSSVLSYSFSSSSSSSLSPSSPTSSSSAAAAQTTLNPNHNVETSSQSTTIGKPLRFFDHPSGKHKTPKKRASKILNILQKEELERLKNNRVYPNVQPGDSVAIEKLPFMSSTEPEVIKGVIIAKVNRLSDTALTLLNVEHGTPVVRRIVMYSPLVVSIKILQKAFIHEGKKRVRRSKLYYLMNRDPEEFTVK